MKTENDDTKTDSKASEVGCSDLLCAFIESVRHEVKRRTSEDLHFTPDEAELERFVKETLEQVARSFTRAMPDSYFSSLAESYRYPH